MKISFYISLLFFSWFLCANAQPQEESSDYFSLAVSQAFFDVLKQDDLSVEGRLELRYERPDWVINTFAGVMANTDGANHYFAGIFHNFKIFKNLFFTPSFAPGLYFYNRSKHLHFLLQFRSQIEFSYRVTEHSGVAISFNHISNGSLAKDNPGVESLALTYLIGL